MPAPTSQEQYLLELINEARLDPLRNAARYINSYTPLASSDPDIQSAVNFFNVSGSALLSAYQGLSAVAPLAWNNNLSSAAQGHNAAMIAEDEQSHQVAGEPGLGTRVNNAGYSGWTLVAENVYAYSKSMIYGHAGFMIDWGNGPNGMQSPAGHRNNIMSSGLSEVGIAVTAENNPATDVGPYVITQDFGERGLMFVLGVAYTDSDHDDFYSVGEGRGDLTVQWGGSSTTSAASGGYALAITSGLKTITLSGGGLSGSVTVTTTIGSDSIKLDVVDGDTLLTSGSVEVSGAVSIIRAIGVVGSGLTITAGEGSQEIHGYSGNDTLSGGNGDDEFHGGAGNDAINGGGGSDTAVYEGDHDDYTVSSPSAGNFTVSGPGIGTDTLTSIELFRFADGEYAWTEGQLVSTSSNAPPTVAASQSVSTNEDTAKQVTVSGSDTDGDTLSYSAGSAAHGTVTGGAGGVFTYTPSLNYNGSDSFVVTVSDGHGGSANHTVNVTVTPVNDQPTVAASQSVSTNEDTAKQVTVSGSDVDGDTLSYSAGTAAHGTVTGGSGGVFTYTPDEGYAGSDSFAVTVNDGHGGSANHTVNVTVLEVNDPPTVSASQSVSTDEDTAKQVTVSGSDPNGDALSYSAGPAGHGTVSGGAGGVFTYTPALNYNGSDSFVVTVSDGKGGTTNHTVNVTVAPVNDDPALAASQSLFTDENTAKQVTVGATDADGDALNYSAGAAAHGIVSGGAGGLFTYTPDTDFIGLDSFLVTVDDGHGGTAGQTVNVTVLEVNDPPTVAAGQSVSTDEDTSKQVTVSGSDDNGDTLTYSAGAPSHGFVTGGAGGVFTYTPDADFNGSDSFIVTVSDGKGGTANHTVSVTVAPVEDPPTVAASQSVVTSEDIAKQVAVGGFDPDGDTLSYSAGTAGHGSVTGGAGGVFTYTPDGNYHGSDSFTVNVSDGHGGTASQTVNITVLSVNDAPTVAASQSFSTQEDTARQFTVSGTDPDGDTLSYSAGPAAHGSVSGGAGGVFTYTPDGGFNGSDSFTVTASDGNGGTAQQTVDFTVTLGNTPPSIAPVQNVFTSEDTARQVTVSGSDPDGDTLSYAASQGSHGTVSGGTGGVFSYMPDSGFLGSDSFTVTASDGNGGTAMHLVNISVAEIPEANELRMFASDGYVGGIGGSGQVFGTAGFQDIAVLDVAGTIAFDPSFNKGGDIVRLSGNAGDWQVVQSGSVAIFSDGDTFIQLPVGTAGTAILFDDGVRSLRFDSGAGGLKIGAQGFGSELVQVTAPADGTALPSGAYADASARLFLGEGASASAGGHLDVFGTAGAEQLTVTGGEVTLDPSFNKGGDTLVLGEPAPDFLASRSGSTVLLDGAATDVVIPVGIAGMTIAFPGDEERTLLFDTILGSPLLAAQEIDTTPTALAAFG
ncbi:MAG: tandem-95 repeat protein [Novosphingobium sp.]|nr:tandem-95 repeat protein [Novosphingobium sp.]MCP5401165.1 tandem-95 repeat protein [Novosphingobium sp.]